MSWKRTPLLTNMEGFCIKRAIVCLFGFSNCPQPGLQLATGQCRVGTGQMLTWQKMIICPHTYHLLPMRERKVHLLLLYALFQSVDSFFKTLPKIFVHLDKLFSDLFFGIQWSFHCWITWRTPLQTWEKSLHLTSAGEEPSKKTSLFSKCSLVRIR